MRTSIIGATALALAILATACGDGGPPRVSVDGVEFAYEPDMPSVAAGTVELRFRNTGAQAHNIVFEDGTGLTAAGLEDFTGPGGTVTYELELTPGTYGFWCSVPGHLEAGMEGTLIVE